MAQIRVRCGSDRVRCGSDRVRCGSDEGAVWLRLGCGVAQIVARRLAVRQARVRISESNEWCSTSSIHKILYVCSINVKINEKEWQRATKPLT